MVIVKSPHCRRTIPSFVPADGIPVTVPRREIALPWNLGLISLWPSRVNISAASVGAGFSGSRLAVSGILRQMARRRLTRYRSVSGRPATSTASPHAGGGMSARLTLTMSPSFILTAKLSFCQTAITAPMAEWRPRFTSCSLSQTLIDAIEGTEKGSFGGGLRISMLSIERMLISDRLNRLNPLKNGE